MSARPLVLLVAGFIICLCLGPMTLAFETDQATLRFSHYTHHKQKVACVKCHPTALPERSPEPSELPPGWAPLKPSRVADRPAEPVGGGAGGKDSENPFGRPPEKLCLTCHGETRTKSDCGLCHLGKPGPTERPRKRLMKGVTFDHTRHNTYSCQVCHTGINNWATLNGSQIDTRMPTCLVCHNGVKAKKTCKMCHKPTPWPKDHVRNYEKKHGIDYRLNPRRCHMCHEDSSCVACHSKKPRDHTAAWIARRHGFTAQTNPRKCEACHADRDICRRCHPGR